MDKTNELLKIAGASNNDMCILLIILGAIFLVYIVTSIEVQRNRVNKLKEAAKLIQEGHNRRMMAKKKKGE